MHFFICFEGLCSVKIVRIFSILLYSPQSFLIFRGTNRHTIQVICVWNYFFGDLIVNLVNLQIKNIFLFAKFFFVFPSFNISPVDFIQQLFALLTVLIAIVSPVPFLSFYLSLREIYFSLYFRFINYLIALSNIFNIYLFKLSSIYLNLFSSLPGPAIAFRFLILNILFIY